MNGGQGDSLDLARSDVAASRFRSAIRELEVARAEAWSSRDLKLMQEVLALAIEAEKRATGARRVAQRLSLKNLIVLIEAGCDMLVRSGASAHAAREEKDLEPIWIEPEPSAASDLEDRLTGLSVQLLEARRAFSARFERLERELADVREAAVAQSAARPAVGRPALPPTRRQPTIGKRPAPRPTPRPAAPRPVSPTRPEPPASEPARPSQSATRGATRPARPPERSQAPPPAHTPKPPPSLTERALTRLACIQLSDLLGARTLAWTGAIVSMLGIALLFVLAIDRGWVGPEVRLAFGALASITAVGLALWLRRRFGEYYAALGAAGAGIAGAYATLLSAAAIYDFIPAGAALIAAAAIAGVGVWVSVAWSSQMVAGLGLIGAMASAPVVQQDVTIYGGAFIALVAAATAGVAIHQGWRELLILGGAVSAGEIGLVLAGAEPGPDWRLVALAGVFWLIYTGTGIAYQLRAGEMRLRPLAAVFILAGVSLAGAAVAQLFEGTSSGVDEQGAALLLVAVVQGLIAAGLMVRRAPRDLSSLMWVTGLVVAAVAAGLLLQGTWLTLAWAATAAALAWLSVNLNERRFQVAAAVYLGLAAGHALAIEAVPDQLFTATPHPAHGAISVAFVVAAATIFAWYCRPLTPPPYHGPPAYTTPATWLNQRQNLWQHTTNWIAAALTIYATSLAILELAVWVGGSGFEVDFDRGHVAVTAFWGVLALAALTLGRWRRWQAFELASFVLFGIAVAKLVGYDAGQLDETLAWLSSLCLGASVLAGSAIAQQLSERPSRLDPIAVLLGLASIPLLAPAVSSLVSGDAYGIDLTGAALLGLALTYGILAAAFFRRQRDYSSLMWVTGLVVAAVAAGLLLQGTWLTLAWAATAAALAWLSVNLNERRFQVAAAVYLGLAAGHALAIEAVPDQLFTATPHPAHGAISVAFVVAAATIFAWYCRPLTPPPYHGPPAYTTPATWLNQRQNLWQHTTNWIAAALTIYATSLAILELAVWVGGSGFEVDTNFQRGHAGVSAFWGVVGLLLLYLGLAKGSRAVRLTGFAWFGALLAKIFIYDLRELSSVARALSFLAVGALLLAGAFLYQRITKGFDDRNPRGPKPRGSDQESHPGGATST